MTQTIEIPVQGMDCANCARHVQTAIAALPGVEQADVLLSAEKAVVQMDPTRTNQRQIHEAITGAGYTVPSLDEDNGPPAARQVTRQVLTVFGLVFGAVFVIVVLGEWFGLLDSFTERVPWSVGLLVVLVGGFPVFRAVIQAALKGRIISHTLMTVGVIAALVVGEWATALIVVFFMRVGDYVEQFTAERARRAVKDLTALAPQTARLERDGVEMEVPIAEVHVDDVVVVRPGEKIPVDGTVIEGQATVNQAAITGESMPVEVSAGASVFAATLNQLGHLRVQTRYVGADTTFGRVIKMVEEAEAHRGDIQRLADKFATYYLPVVATVAALTYFISGNALATTAVLVVACSCSFALATPIAVLASIGAAARQGILIKGGKYLEVLAQADVLLVDKTGTLTLGQPQITDIRPLNGLSGDEILSLAAAAERYSEHPLAEAVRVAAQTRALTVPVPEGFEAMPGRGVRAQVNGQTITVGSQRTVNATPTTDLEAQGKTLLWVSQGGDVLGVLAAADTPRAEVPAALAAVRALGINRVEILTGDNEPTAAALAASMDGVSYRANLLPEDKIAIVKAYQAEGHTVVMVGDGINDAPALAQADVGIAMGQGTDIALEAGHIALMRSDWRLVPAVLKLSQRTMGVVKLNIGFTAVYNMVGLSLAAVGILPPALAAAAQSLPDLGILANSSRLLRQRSNLLADSPAPTQTRPSYSEN